MSAGCPSCGLESGLYHGFKGVLCCDNCGWWEGKPDDKDEA